MVMACGRQKPVDAERLLPKDTVSKERQKASFSENQDST